MLSRTDILQASDIEWLDKLR
nr:hypothetical protein [Photorhabdus hainanensis]